MFELAEHPVVVFLSDTFRIAAGALDECLERALQQLVDLAVVVIVVPDAQQALDVVPNGATEP